VMGGDSDTAGDLAMRYEIHLNLLVRGTRIMELSQQ